MIIRNPRDWNPNSVESTCLSHLDHAENWKILRRPRPEEDVIQGWSPFIAIFGINLAQFTLILGLLFVGLEFSQGGGLASLREDALIGSGVVVGVASLLAGYVTHLYRRSWNRRARKMRAEREDELRENATV